MASSPRRCASSGSAPPPAKGSWKAGSLSPVEELLGARMIRVVRARAAPAPADFGSGFLEHGLVRGIFPLHELLEDGEEPLTLDVGGHAFECRLRLGGGIARQFFLGLALLDALSETPPAPPWPAPRRKAALRCTPRDRRPSARR
jgi:hypothetical protein